MTFHSVHLQLIVALSLITALTFTQPILALALQGSAMGKDSVSDNLVGEHNNQLTELLSGMQPKNGELEQVREEYLRSPIDISPKPTLRQMLDEPRSYRLFGIDGILESREKPAAKSPLKCLAKWEKADHRPKVHILYERHDNENSKLERQRIIDLALQGEAIVLLESDFSNAFPQSESIHQPQYSYQRGVERTVLQHDRKNTGTRNIRGADHALFRAFASLSYWFSKRRTPEADLEPQILEELVRNDHLRSSLYAVAGSHRLAKCFIDKLNRMENATQPRLESAACPNIEEGLWGLLADMNKHLDSLHPVLAKLPYELMQFQLRDNAMTIATLNALCDALDAGIRDVYLSVGYLHLAGVHHKLGKYISSDDIVDKNTTAPDAKLDSDNNSRALK